MEIDEGCTGKQVEDWQEKDIFPKGKKKRKRRSKGVFYRDEQRKKTTGC